jgi:hypothetical protein
MRSGWGLVEVRGRRVMVLRKSESQPQHNLSEELAQLVQALSHAQLRAGSEPLHLWLSGPESPVGQMRAEQRETRKQIEERQRSAKLDRSANLQWLILNIYVGHSDTRFISILLMY